LIQEVIERLSEFCDVKLKKLDGVEENITFKLPRELIDAERNNASAI